MMTEQYTVRVQRRKIALLELLKILLEINTELADARRELNELRACLRESDRSDSMLSHNFQIMTDAELKAFGQKILESDSSIDNATMIGYLNEKEFRNSKRDSRNDSVYRTT